MAVWGTTEGAGDAEQDVLPTYRIWPLRIEEMMGAGVRVAQTIPE